MVKTKTKKKKKKKKASVAKCGRPGDRYSRFPAEAYQSLSGFSAWRPALMVKCKDWLHPCQNNVLCEKESFICSFYLSVTTPPTTV